jgi:hypothetical protein
MTSKEGSGNNDALDKDKRKRLIYQVWERNPNGPILRGSQIHTGHRTPNGQRWGHSLSDFYWIETIPGVSGLLGIWSTSMLQKLNDSLSPSQKELLAADQHYFPRVLQPWPLLCIPNDKGEKETLCPGGDEGCERGHDPAIMFPRVSKIGDYLEAGMRVSDVTPEQKQRLVLAVRSNFKQTITKGMTPEITKVDPRFHIPDQSVPSNQPPPKLEEFIPKEYLPDVLLVYDPSCVADGRHGRCFSDGELQSEAVVPIRYTRTHSAPMKDEHLSNVAHLYLSPRNLCGTGNHSYVYHAPLMLPAPLTARTPTRQVTVLAKTSFPGFEHRDLLNQEGVIYDAFPQWMMEDYCGFNIVNGIHVSVLGYHGRRLITNPASRACMCYRSKILWFLCSGGQDSEILEPYSTTRRLWYSCQDIYSPCRRQVRFSPLVSGCLLRGLFYLGRKSMLCLSTFIMLDSYKDRFILATSLCNPARSPSLLQSARWLHPLSESSTSEGESTRWISYAKRSV